MNSQGCFADYSVPITLKEAIRARSHSYRGNEHHQLESPVRVCGHNVGRRLPVVEQKTCLRKKFPRFAPRLGLYVLHREFGRVVSIGMGGICFTYFDDSSRQGELPRQGLLVASNNQFLDGLPFETMADLVVIPNFAGKYRVKRRCVHFGKLNDSQIEALEQFILKNAHIPQLAGAPF